MKTTNNINITEELKNEKIRLSKMTSELLSNIDWIECFNEISLISDFIYNDIEVINELFKNDYIKELKTQFVEDNEIDTSLRIVISQTLEDITLKEYNSSINYISFDMSFINVFQLYISHDYYDVKTDDDFVEIETLNIKDKELIFDNKIESVKFEVLNNYIMFIKNKENQKEYFNEIIIESRDEDIIEYYNENIIEEYRDNLSEITIDTLNDLEYNYRGIEKVIENLTSGNYGEAFYNEFMDADEINEVLIVEFMKYTILMLNSSYFTKKGGCVTFLNNIDKDLEKTNHIIEMLESEYNKDFRLLYTIVENNINSLKILSCEDEIDVDIADIYFISKEMGPAETYEEYKDTIEALENLEENQIVILNYLLENGSNYCNLIDVIEKIEDVSIYEIGIFINVNTKENIVEEMIEFFFNENVNNLFNDDVRYLDFDYLYSEILNDYSEYKFRNFNYLISKY